MKKNVWLIRPFPHGTDHLNNFLQNDFIAVGYPVGESFEDCSYNDIRKALSKYGWEEGLGNVNILVKAMAIGDIVIVPSVNKKDVYFGEVISDYIYDKSVDDRYKEGLGYPHQRRVKWLFNKKSLLRTDLPEEVRASLRYPGTVADFTKHCDIINPLINGSEIPVEGIKDIEVRAISVLEDLLESENEAIRLQAAQTILSLKR